MTLKFFSCLVWIAVLTLEFKNIMVQQAMMDKKSFISDLPHIYF